MASERGKKIPGWKRGKFKGRSNAGHSFVMLRHDIIDSPAYRALSGTAVKLLVFLARQYNGTNNGNLSMAMSDLTKEGWRSEATATKARDELLEAGFIIITRHGVKRVCHLFALSWYSIDECPGKFLEVAATVRALDTWKTKSLPQKLESVTPESDAKAA